MWGAPTNPKIAGRTPPAVVCGHVQFVVGREPEAIVSTILLVDCVRIIIASAVDAAAPNDGWGRLGRSRQEEKMTYYDHNTDLNNNTARVNRVDSSEHNIKDESVSRVPPLRHTLIHTLRHV